MQLISSFSAVSASLLVSSLFSTSSALPTNTTSGECQCPPCTRLDKSLRSSGAVVNVNVAQASVSVYYSSTYPAGAAKSTAIIVPSVIASSILGPATQSPATQYLAVPTQALPTLSTSEKSDATINADLAADFSIWNGTGTIKVG